ncbi:MAG: hypothetical protein ACYDDU_15455 [Dermatophilaceae bacterium]
MRRPLLVGALVAAVIALVASVAVAVGTLGRASGSSMMRGYNQGLGPDMMGGRGQSQWSDMMGGPGQGTSMMGGSIMGSTGSMGMTWLPGNGVAVSGIPAARTRATTAAAPAGLRPGEVMWFDNGFYVELKDSAGLPATEVIVDPRTGAVSTEPGPAMMWNTRFGMRARGADTAAVDATKAREIATAWLAANQAGTTIGSIDAYPGYFTLDLQRGGTVSGMMSVNSSTGAVWYHTWHGAFIAKEDS